MQNKTKIIGKQVTVTIDRPLGSVHPKHPNLIYPIHYGYVADFFAGDGEEQDVYLLGVDHPVQTYEAVIIAVIHRINDIEDKWVAAPKDRSFSAEEIKSLTDFQEKYFSSVLLLK